MQGNSTFLTFVRHGQSTKNQAAHLYAQERNLPFDWDLFTKDPIFWETVTHNPLLIDAHLSQKGKIQCLQTKQQLKNFFPDIILVSPLQRALETCNIIFEGKAIKRIVQPLLSQTFRHTSQICKSIQIKKKDFPDFDFSKVQVQGQFWFIKNDSVENQQKYFQFLKQIQTEYYNQKIQQIAEFMHAQKMYEDGTNVRNRAKKIKQILKEYSKTYKSIAIVTHFYTIRYLATKQFDENNKPLDKLTMQNCGRYEISLDQLCKQ